MKSKMSKTKKQKQFKNKSNPFRVTFKSVVTVVLIVQLIAIIIIGFSVYFVWDTNRIQYDNQIITQMSQSLDRDYDKAKTGSIRAYKSNVIEWPEYGLGLPYSYDYGDIYITSYPEEDGSYGEFRISNDNARYSNPPSTVGDGDTVYKFFEQQVPYIMSCSRDIIASTGSASSENRQDYSRASTIKLNDGRVFEIYSSNICQYDGKPKFLEYIKNLQSL